MDCFCRMSRWVWKGGKILWDFSLSEAFNFWLIRFLNSELIYWQTYMKLVVYFSKSSDQREETLELQISSSTAEKYNKNNFTSVHSNMQSIVYKGSQNEMFIGGGWNVLLLKNPAFFVIRLLQLLAAESFISLVSKVTIYSFVEADTCIVYSS